MPRRAAPAVRWCRADGSSLPDRQPYAPPACCRLTTEPEPGDTIILEDGTEVPLKKKRGRPKKVKLENGEVAPPAPRAPRQPRQPAQLDPNGDQPPKKKRGRPKKIRPEEQQFLLQQQQQQQQVTASRDAGTARFTSTVPLRSVKVSDRMLPMLFDRSGWWSSRAISPEALVRASEVIRNR